MWIIVLAVILGVIALVMGAGILFTGPGRQEIMDLTIRNVDFSKLHDGTYVGEYKGKKDSFRDAAVEIIVASGAITDIKVVKGALAKEKPVEMRNGMTINDLFGRVIDAQSLQVDVISGATLTSKVHLKAVENALEQAEIK